MNMERIKLYFGLPAVNNAVCIIILNPLPNGIGKIANLSDEASTALLAASL